MNENLKPCPFCGSENVEMDSLITMFFITCNNCEAEGPTASSEEYAGYLWNNRHNEGGDEDEY